MRLSIIASIGPLAKFSAQCLWDQATHTITVSWATTYSAPRTLHHKNHSISDFLFGHELRSWSQCVKVVCIKSLCCIYLRSLACLWSKNAYVPVGGNEGRRSWYLHWLQNPKTLKLRCPFFSQFMKWNSSPLTLKSVYPNAIRTNHV